MTLKLFQSRAKPVKARMFTWECVTGFDEEFLDEALLQKFKSDFSPSFDEKRPVFLKLFSFNAPDGRRHRYLVIFLNEIGCANDNCKRFLPESISLFGMCDKKMRDSDGFQNYCFYEIVGDVLYILVFAEGRLCHWSEEPGYGNFGGEGACVLEDRIERFRGFLEQDAFFSREESFVFEEGSLNTSFDYGDLEWASFFERASADPFWKKVCLNGASKKRNVKLWVALFLTFSVILILVSQNRRTGLDGNVDLWLSPAVELQAAEPFLSFEKKERVEFPVGSRRTKTEEVCEAPSFKVNGVVEGVLFQWKREDGSVAWLRPGDSIGEYRVASVNRDRVRVYCRGEAFDVFSGS